MSDGHGHNGDHGHEEAHGEHDHEEKKDIIKTWKKLKKKAQRLLDTTEHHHRKAYLSAEEKVLTEDGEIDYDKLEKEEHQLKFAEAMTDHYVSQAQKYLKADKDLDVFQKNTLMLAYSGTTQETLLSLLAQHGKDFKEKFPGIKNQLTDALRKRLNEVSTAHIRGKKHIEDVLKYTGTHEFVDPKYMPREKALELLDTYEAAGALSKERVAEQYHEGGLGGVLTDKAKAYVKEYLTKKEAEKKEEMAERKKHAHHAHASAHH